MKYSFHPEAESEFIEAIAYYEENQAGLGYDFAAEVYLTLERIATHPQAWQLMEEGIRRALVSRFPHLHREPDYWKHRT